MKPYKTEKECKLIRSKDGKWLGDSISGREWKDNPIDAIAWKIELDDISKIYNDGIDLSEATLVKAKKIIQIEIYEQPR